MASATPSVFQPVTPTPTVSWSNGEPFDGYVIFGLAQPTGLVDPSIQYFGSLSKQQLPQWTRVAVIGGVLSNVERLYQNASIDPPNTKYAIYWTDRAFNVLHTPTENVEINVAQYTLTVPTLTPPPATSTVPPLQTADGAPPSGWFPSYVNGELIVRAFTDQTDPLQIWEQQVGTQMASIPSADRRIVAGYLPGANFQSDPVTANSSVRAIYASNIYWDESAALWQVDDNGGGDWAMLMLAAGGVIQFASETGLTLPTTRTNAQILAAIKWKLDASVVTQYNGNYSYSNKLGSGSPVGVVSGGIGDRYTDVTNGRVWINETGGTSGWQQLATANTGFLYSASGTINLTRDTTTLLVDSSSAPVIVNLPASDPLRPNHQFVIKALNNLVYTVTITPAGGETIEGSATQTLTFPNQCITIIDNGLGWSIIGRSI